MTKIAKPKHSLLCLFLAFVSPWFVFAAGEQKPKVVFFPPDATYTGGFATYAGTELVEAPGKNSFTLSNSKAVGFVRWFAKHDPMPKGKAEEWRDCAVSLEVRLLHQGGSTKITASWRGEADPAEFGPETEVNPDLKVDEWTRVLIPNPSVSGIASDNLTGLFIKMDRPGDYEVRRLEIVPSSSKSQHSP